jgi:hypothetical protein
VIGGRDQAERWLAAGLCLSRVAVPTESEVARTAPWIVATIGERLDLPPPGVVSDLGAMLHGEALPARAARLGDARLETALRRYEDAVLGRLGAEPGLAAVVFAIAKLPPELRAEGVGIFVAGVLGHARFAGGVPLPPGLVRSLSARPSKELLERGYGFLRDDATAREALAEGYEALVRGARDARALVSDADVFALENLGVLRSHTQRVAIAQVVEAQEALTLALPRRIRARRKPPGDAATRMVDESTYPVGGFSSLSTSGSLENLVTSELIYMDPPSADPSARAPVDLFDMRYAEGELLYYTRDEAILRRRRRVIAFILAPDLTAVRVKDPSLPWQRVILLLGAVLAAIKRLSAELGDEALLFRVVFARESDAQPSPLKAERELSELLFREWREKGALDVAEATVAREAATLEAASRGALVHAALFSTGATSAEPLGDLADVHTRGLAEALDLEGWGEACAEIVAGLL